jgi:uncharacterized protein
VDWLNALAGLCVGALVGLTGVGGGSLMSPVLILLFGVAPATAVGTDLWFAAITKTVGGAVHHRHDGADWPIVGRLAIGSLPAALATLGWLAMSGGHQAKSGLIVQALGGVLVLTAIVTPFRGVLVRRFVLSRIERAGEFVAYQPVLTVLAGAVLGVMVTLTSVGAGALGATMLLALYPVRLTARRLVGTDIIHAVPLTLVGGIGHLLIGNVDVRLLASLLVGSVPGIVIGSLLANRLSERVVRPALAMVLLVVGLKLVIA